VVLCAYRILIGKPDGKNYLEDLPVDGDNIKRDCKETQCDGVYWIHLA
jgi:hypothetical protein